MTTSTERCVTVPDTGFECAVVLVDMAAASQLDCCALEYEESGSLDSHLLLGNSIDGKQPIMFLAMLLLVRLRPGPTTAKDEPFGASTHGEKSGLSRWVLRFGLYEV